MKVLIVHPSLSIYGGAELAIVELVKFLYKKGVHTDIVTNSVSYKVKRDLDSLCNFNILLNPDVLEGLSSFVHRKYREYDVINMHNNPAHLTLYPYKHPSVWVCNEPETALETGCVSSKELLYVKESIGEIVTNSEYNKEWIDKLYGYDSKIVRYGVDHEFFDKANPNNPNILKYKLPEYNFKIVHSGWFNQYKNQLASIEAFSMFSKEVPDSNLILVGETSSSYAHQVFKKIRSSGCSDKIIVTGMVDRETARDWYSIADVMINPARKQGSFISTYEALSMGVPIMVSNEVPDIEFLRRENLCIVTDDFYKSLLDFYNKKLHYNVARSREYVRKILTWNNYGSTLLKIFEETLNC